MLTITGQAASAIRQLLAGHETRGRVLRIVERPAGRERRLLMLALSRELPTDLVVAERGLRIFVELGLAERLENRRLDVRREGERVRFLVEQVG